MTPSALRVLALAAVATVKDPHGRRRAFGLRVVRDRSRGDAGEPRHGGIPTSRPAVHGERESLERFTRIDPQTIDYRFRVEDPVYVYRAIYHAAHDHRAARVSAHEYSRTKQHGGRSGLSGERAYERHVAEARAKGLPDPAPDDRDGGLLGRAGRGPSACAGDRVQVRCSLSDRDSLFPCNRVAGGGPAC